MMVRLEQEEKVVYTALIRINRNKGFAPTRKEISDFTGLSTYRIQKSLATLKEYGLIEVTPRTPRAIRLTGYELVPRRDLAKVV